VRIGLHSYCLECLGREVVVCELCGAEAALVSVPFGWISGERGVLCPSCGPGGDTVSLGERVAERWDFGKWLASLRA